MTDPAGRHRFLALDGLRGVAALAVLGLHLTAPFAEGPHVPNAGLAVDFFFLLSGFVIGFSYDRRLRSGGMAKAEFLRRRVIRLYPMILLGAALASLTLLVRIAVRGEWSLLPGLAGSTLFGALLIPSHFIGGPGYEVIFLNIPAWSLFFEAAANLVYALFAHRLGTRTLAVVTALMGLVLLAVCLTRGLEVSGVADILARGAWRVGFSFGLGVLLFRAYQTRKPPPAAAAPAIACAGLLGVILLAPGLGRWANSDAAVAIFLAFPVIVWIVARAKDPPGPLASLCERLGRLSYPLYMLHYPFVHMAGFLARNGRLSGPALIGFEAVVGLAAIGFAWLCLVLIDEPVRGWWDRRWRPYPPRQVSGGS